MLKRINASSWHSALASEMNRQTKKFRQDCMKKTPYTISFLKFHGTSYAIGSKIKDR